MKRWRLVLPGFELALFALIPVLPQVDLPDFTFSSGTASVAVHSRLSSSPFNVVVGFIPLVPPLLQMTEGPREILDGLGPRTLGSRLSRLCILIC